MGSSTIGSGMINPQVSLQQARESQLLQQMQSAANSGQTSPGQLAKIKKGAQEFETLLLSGWLQQAEQSLATVPGTDDDEDDQDGRDQMMSLGVQQLAGSMAANGGIGIAAMITRAMTHMAEKTQAAEGTSGPTPLGAEISPKNEPFPLNSTAGNADRMAVSRKGSK